LVASLSLALAGARVAVAQAPCVVADPCGLASQSSRIGDINSDGSVNAQDITFWQDCIRDNLAASGVYCPYGDLNFDGRIDDADLNYLQQAVTLATDPAIGALPKTLISEVRTGKSPDQTNPTIPPSRYVELSTPGSGESCVTTSIPNPAPDSTGTLTYGPGWYYLKVTLSRVGGATQLGTVAVVVPLDGMVWVSEPFNPILPRGNRTYSLSLIADSSFVPGSVLYDTVPDPDQNGLDLRNFILTLPAGQSLEVPAFVGGTLFPPEEATNVTHLVVFRNPDPANPRAEPQVGQRVNGSVLSPADQCALPWLVPGSPDLPPWDLISDAVTIIRGGAAAYGCVFANTGIDDIGPVGSGDQIEAPIHIYRCGAGVLQIQTGDNLRVGPRAIRSDGDTPFRWNFVCSFVPSGCGEFGGDGGYRSCFETHSNGRGCTDADCCIAVSEVDPTCRTGLWDEACVKLALEVCTTCGSTQTSCTVAHPTPSCSDAECCQLVCGIDPSCCEVAWDEGCASLAIQRCVACGKEAAGSCTEPHDTPYCSDQACCELVCEVSPPCCSTAWDQACVNIAIQKCEGCGSPDAGDCCIVHATPFCSDGDCCAAVCDKDPFCCEVSWDVGCALLTLTEGACLDLGCVCGKTGPKGEVFSCFEERRDPGCSDAYCCQIICTRDPYCCYVAWDEVCVDAANDNCTLNPACIDADTGQPAAGSCFLPHKTPGCDRPGCCGKVCEIDPTCCEAASGEGNIPWDEACVKIASTVCFGCGDSFAGSCFEPHGEPNCGDAACCTAVCEVDSFCCTVEWDGGCTSTAFKVCDSPSDACGLSPRSCWVPSYWTRGCSTAACCSLICENIDPYCCDIRWDAICAYQANFVCVPTFPTQIGRESCLVTHAAPGCAVPECMRAVCSVDPSCCTDEWDQRCVQIASGVCPLAASCPADGDCFTGHANPGCSDTTCCNATCVIDPSCCNAEWDAGCAQVARGVCRAPAGSDRPCPCLGDCFNAHENPGCDNETCCDVVCNIAPACCEDEWDQDCASLARFRCCGPVGCGSGCNKGCTVPHPEPYCDDPVCCDVVCREDPACCQFAWDSICVELAIARCATACGMSDAGNCWDGHGAPGCNRPDCCAFVCLKDAFCCTSSWDSTCAQLAADNPGSCIRPNPGDPDAGDPCVPHDNPSSSSVECSAAICKADAFCCETAWDANCAAEALINPDCPCFAECGDPCAGDCCSAHPTPNCRDASCCKLVCAEDPFCCEEEWDGSCSQIARSLCAGPGAACPAPTCGSDELRSCCTASPVPFCSNETCCRAVCALDPICCSQAWDAVCVSYATSKNFADECECVGDGCTGAGGSCVQPHAEPGCEDLACCQTVCSFDPSCCDLAWDASCVSFAQTFCGPGFAPLMDHVRGKLDVPPKPGRFRPGAAPPTPVMPRSHSR
jgi:hypothetical protein